MLLTLFLLGLLYVVLVGVLFAAGASGVLIAVVAGGLLLGQFFVSDKLGLAAMGAKEVTPDQAPGLHAMIERLCIQADLPKPKIAVADTPMPNAFAIGRSQKSATVCATTGLMNMLEPHELEAVMAHELTHVKNRDVMIMTDRELLRRARVDDRAVRLLLRRRLHDDGDDDNPSFLVVLLVSFVVYVLSFFLMLALSRYREFSADRGSALITGRPSALSSALIKISSGMEQVPQQDLRAAEGMSRVLHHLAGGQELAAARSSWTTRRRRSGSSSCRGSRRSSRSPARRSARLRQVGFFDALLGGKRKLQLPARDRLFAMTTAQVTLETAVGLKHRGKAGIAFQSLATADFKEIVADTKELLAARPPTPARRSRRQTTSTATVDLLHDDDFDDLVVSINTVSSSLEAGGYGDRLLAAVFAFEEDGRPVYFIYNFKRGMYYPFVPAPGTQKRNTERELQLKAQVGADLPIETELARWFPLWDIPL